MGGLQIRKLAITFVYVVHPLTIRWRSSPPQFPGKIFDQHSPKGIFIPSSNSYVSFG